MVRPMINADYSPGIAHYLMKTCLTYSKVVCRSLLVFPLVRRLSPRIDGSIDPRALSVSEWIGLDCTVQQQQPLEWQWGFLYYRSVEPTCMGFLPINKRQLDRINIGELNFRICSNKSWLLPSLA